MAKTKSAIGFQIGAFVILAVGTLVILLLNVQPWIAAAKWIAQDILVLPFANTLLNLWGFGDTINFFLSNMAAGIAMLGAGAVCIYLVSQDTKSKNKLSGFHIFLIVAAIVLIAGPGDVINWFWANLIAITAVFLLVVCQVLQLLAWCTETQSARDLLTRVFQGHDLGMNDPKVRKKYKWLAGGAYLMEAFVCMLEYPPYDGGFSGIIADFPILDPYLIQYGEMAKFLITMLSFEGIITLIVGLITGANPTKQQSYD